MRILLFEQGEIPDGLPLLAKEDIVRLQAEMDDGVVDVQNTNVLQGELLAPEGVFVAVPYGVYRKRMRKQDASFYEKIIGLKAPVRLPVPFRCSGRFPLVAVVPVQAVG